MRIRVLLKTVCCIKLNGILEYRKMQHLQMRSAIVKLMKNKFCFFGVFLFKNLSQNSEKYRRHKCKKNFYTFLCNYKSYKIFTFNYENYQKFLMFHQGVVNKTRPHVCLNGYVANDLKLFQLHSVSL